MDVPALIVAVSSAIAAVLGGVAALVHALRKWDRNRASADARFDKIEADVSRVAADVGTIQRALGVGWHGQERRQRGRYL